MPTLDAVKCLQATLLELRDHLDDVAPLEGARLRSIQDSLGQQVGGLRGLLTRHAGGKLHVRAESDSTGYYTWDAWNDIADSREDLPDIRSIRRAISSLDTLIGKLAANEPEPTIGSLHARVEAKALELYRSSHFMEAGEASVRAVRELIRERAGLTLDGEDLVTQAFSVDKPRLRFSDLSTKTQSNEQVGFMTMLQGYWKHVRHVLAHSDDASHLDEQSTWDLLMMASWICRSVDRCETVSSQGAAHQ